MKKCFWVGQDGFVEAMVPVTMAVCIFAFAAIGEGGLRHAAVDAMNSASSQTSDMPSAFRGDAAETLAYLVKKKRISSVVADRAIRLVDAEKLRWDATTQQWRSPKAVKAASAENKRAAAPFR